MCVCVRMCAGSCEGHCHSSSSLLLLFCLLLLLVVVSVSGGGSGSTPVNQTLALQHLYDATEGPEWVWNGGTPWNFSQPLEETYPCDGWHGIVCECVNDTSEDSESESICNIRVLSLFYVDMRGQIPPTISMLEHISILNFGFNLLTGTIPPELFQISTLINVNLGYNLLSGPIPAEVTHIRGMVEFNVFYNLLSGSFPSGMENWTKLKV